MLLEASRRRWSADGFPSSPFLHASCGPSIFSLTASKESPRKYLSEPIWHVTEWAECFHGILILLDRRRTST